MLKRLQMYYALVSLPFVLLLIGAGMFHGAIKSTLDRNPHPQINYTIFVIILFGGVIILINARRLVREARALTAFAKAIHAKVDKAGLRSLANSFMCDIANLLQMIAATSERSISHQEQAALEHELANVHSRLNRRNALPQYLTGLLVGMGLLGTFIGLLATLGDIGALIGSFSDLDMSTDDPIVVFSKMIDKMKAPMQSMAIAFSASMFGLLGSIVLGLMMVGIRRVQGDIFSVLSSETTRHIEMALSHESGDFRPVDGAIASQDDARDLTGKILLRIEERLAESIRMRQRALTAEIDDFKKQRTEMLQVMSAQTAASNSFQGELQKLAQHLGTISQQMEQSNSNISTQLSELTVRLASEARETHKLLAGQLDAQNRLLTALDPARIEERLAAEAKETHKLLAGQLDAQNRLLEALDPARIEERLAAEAKETHKLLAGQLDAQNRLLATLEPANLDERLAEFLRSQQRAITAVIDDLKSQRGQLQQALEGHTETSREVRSELRQLGEHFASLAGNLENGRGELSSQLSEMTVHMGADAKESHRLQVLACNKIRSELQQIGSLLTQGSDKGKETQQRMAQAEITAAAVPAAAG